MNLKSNEEKCKHCGKMFELVIDVLPAKMDEKRESYYCCPYCGEVASTIRLQGDEEVYCKKI